ncbi:MAG: hypothetical protein MSA26_12135 [Lachnospiraceae bacterium]|nr:hypothetical protein [Lachnospiraceae bacterium]
MRKKLEVKILFPRVQKIRVNFPLMHVQTFWKEKKYRLKQSLTTFTTQQTMHRKHWMHLESK